MPSVIGASKQQNYTTPLCKSECLQSFLETFLGKELKCHIFKKQNKTHLTFQNCRTPFQKCRVYSVEKACPIVTSGLKVDQFSTRDSEVLSAPTRLLNSSFFPLSKTAHRAERSAYPGLCGDLPPGAASLPRGCVIPIKLSWGREPRDPCEPGSLGPR